MITSGATSPLESPHMMDSQLASLQSLTVVNSDPQFVSQLRRISRDMYDQLSQHIGGYRISCDMYIGGAESPMTCMTRYRSIYSLSTWVMLTLSLPSATPVAQTFDNVFNFYTIQMLYTRVTITVMEWINPLNYISISSYHWYGSEILAAESFTSEYLKYNYEIFRSFVMPYDAFHYL